MIPYLTVGFFLIVFAAMSLRSQEGKWISTVTLIMLILFCGLRYQIGYDWVAYEKLYNVVQPSLDWRYYNSDSGVLAVEPLYYILNVLVKMMGGSVETLFFIIAAFNLIVIDVVAKEICPQSRPIVWMVYFFIAMVAVQFNIIRQALASSIVLLALVESARRNRGVGLAWLVVALGVHASTVLFLPVVMFSRTYITDKTVLAIVGVSIVLFFSGAMIIGGLGSLVATIAPGFIGSKASAYANGFEAGSGLFGVTPAVAILIILHFGLLYIFCKEPDRDVMTNIAIALTLLLIFSHLAMSQVPSVWNRVMAVALPWQVATLVATSFFQRLGKELQAIGVVMVGIGGAAMMGYQLSRPESLPFVPYHSLVQVWLLDDPGDGRLRSEYSIARAEAEEAWGP